MPRLVWCFLCWSERRLHVTSTALSLRRESRPIEKHKIYNFCHHRFLFHIVYKQINKNIIPLQFIKLFSVFTSFYEHHFSSSFGSSVIVFVIVCLCVNISIQFPRYFRTRNSSVDWQEHQDKNTGRLTNTKTMQLFNQYNVDIKIGRVLEYFQRDNRHRQRVSAWNAKYRFHVLFYIVWVQMCMLVFINVSR